MRIVIRILRETYSALSAAGWLWVGLPMMGSPPVRPVKRLEEPPRAHPERLCPDVALSTTELALQRQLMAPTGEHE